MNPRYPLVARRAGHRCEYCRAPEAIFNLPFEVEHIIPRSKHGGDDESNWALACRSCNLYKSDQLEGLDEATGEVLRLFHPRQDLWENHFRVDPESGTIAGLTPIGRATVSTFQMNRPNQLAARRQWMPLRLFP
jgi:hypothetical protein